MPPVLLVLRRSPRDNGDEDVAGRGCIFFDLVGLYGIVVGGATISMGMEPEVIHIAW